MTGNQLQATTNMKANEKYLIGLVAIFAVPIVSYFVISQFLLNSGLIILVPFISNKFSGD